MAQGRRRAEKAARGAGRLARALLLLLGTAFAVAAWALLVRQAITLGRDARGGLGAGTWALAGGATVGAAVCLLLALVLLARARAAWQRTPTAPRRAPGHRR